MYETWPKAPGKRWGGTREMGHIQINALQNDIFEIVLNRSDKANAITEQMLKDLVTAVDEHAFARAIIFSGAGRHFSAGADLSDAASGLATSKTWEVLSGKVTALKGVSIAAINGTAAGGSLGMVFACDFRIGTRESSFFYPVMRHGFLPQPSDPRRLESLVGRARTREFFLTGRRINAEAAYEWGLLNALIPGENMTHSCLDFLGDIVGSDASHVSAVKRSVIR